MTAKTSDGVIGRALDLVFQVAELGDADAKTIARHAGLPLSTTYRLLGILTAKGFVQRTRDGSFSAGWAPYYLANAAASSQTLPARAQPILDELANELAETAFLAIRNGDQFVIIGKAEAAHELRMTFPLGAHLPIQRGALGRIFQAFDDRSSGESALITRERGYATSDEDAAPGVRAVAAPVFDHGGALVAALSIAGPVPRFQIELATTSAVVSAANRLSRLLGHGADTMAPTIPSQMPAA